MEEVSNVAVLITHSSAASTPSALGSLSQSRSRRDVDGGTSQGFQQKQAADSLIQVIEKLSKIVEKRPQRRCTLAGQKRAPSAGGGEEEGSRGGSPFRKIKRGCKGQESADEEEGRLDGGGVALSPPVPGDSNNNSVASGAASHKRTVTCYQCSLCPYLSQTLPLLKEHLKQHNEQHSDLILMCSECHFTSRDQGQLEAHVRLHFDGVKEEVLETQDGDWSAVDDAATEALRSSSDGSTELPQKKKWYSYEEYGLYRCLICSYVCSQQRMLKTHAWKHAGLVDCSYPIFEDEAPAAANAPAMTREELVVLPPVLQDKSLQKLPAGFKLQLCVPMAAESKRDAPIRLGSDLSGSLKTEEEEKEYPIKDLTEEQPAVEVQVMTEAESELETDGPHDGASATDSLLSSAQNIINSTNSAGHINVIVERLPSAEDAVMATNPLLLNPDMERDKNLVGVKEEEERDCAGAGEVEAVDVKPSLGSDAPRDENIPPAGRKRTHSESLRLHSLAAEVLVAMPMRTPELLPSGPKVSLKTLTAQAQSPNSGQRLVEAGQRASDAETTAALLDLELHGGGREEDLGSLGEGDEEEEGPATKAGISLSLLTVIERLRERSDQNASDEDILKELQDNAQFQNGAVVAANGAGGYVCGIPGMDGLVASAADGGGGGLVDYIPGSERPYRCRLCRYSSGNKGYIKQHLRVHRQRQPYQCPICEHIASDSKDLESHMIHHCKTRMYQCKQCADAFHYKSQLRSHERERHSFGRDTAALTPVTETAAMVEEAELVADEECGLQKMYKCDVCDYTSSTYVGVRNHRRIHNSDKPYRCCSCDFATTNMNSLKSHMRRHPQEHQAVQLLEQYRCSLCGYVCSHPPSLKSHMWKHAGDQNYNYEQVNKAINEAISQSSRAPQKLSAVPESAAERPAVAPPSQDKAQGSVEPAAVTTDSSAGLLSDQAQWPGRSPSPQGKDPAQSQSQPRAGQAALGPGMEYCMLLFCCCICGFESTSKERLMEHMKEHEGDIISIILNKEQQQQQQQQQQQAEAQTAE
ncbi:zinc finger protein 507 isoform X2 [Clinocottus analis]